MNTSNSETLNSAMSLRQGLLSWKAADQFVDDRALKKAMRDNWDRRIGKSKFSGVWSIAMARTNLFHPASIAAMEIGRENWSGTTVTVEHAIPINVLFKFFLTADTKEEMQLVIDAYHVAVVTRQEDQRLRELGLNSKMPDDWSWGDKPFARWELAGISATWPNKSTGRRVL